ncbi:MAG: phosphate/phosphite/phosphonate ABC transporter substrate-binding protein [Desulfomonile tiedjei]|uniref:Phosphate/phosphite/phosphonate ABC transporter substrate-binding protein n=1 Tax=Desulfomonile tiedjei TaxID=2358 RepID=A0A9D6Z6J0_9BACT|nr:phosphate/phosphite/phosphonate ABC transporter substrate-binding protein [Desulfomonile tiedjei]
MCTKFSKSGATVLLLGLFALVLLARPPHSYPTETYSFGVVPQYDQRHLFRIWKPLLDLLQERAGLSFKLATTKRIPEFEKDYEQGCYDFIYLNPYHLLKASESQGYFPIICDRTDLHGILVVRKDSPIEDVKELNGKVVAFPSPNALGASLLMRADLLRIYHLRFSPVYVNSHDSVYLHVVKGLADAGGGVQKTLQEQEEPVQDSLRILYTTRGIPSHPIAVHPRVPKSATDKLISAFVELQATKKGQELLSKIPMNHPVPTSMDAYSIMKDWGLEPFWVEK